MRPNSAPIQPAWEFGLLAEGSEVVVLLVTLAPAGTAAWRRSPAAVHVIGVLDADGARLGLKVLDLGLAQQQWLSVPDSLVPLFRRPPR